MKYITEFEYKDLSGKIKNRKRKCLLRKTLKFFDES